MGRWQIAVCLAIHFRVARHPLGHGGQQKLLGTSAYEVHSHDLYQSRIRGIDANRGASYVAAYRRRGGICIVRR